MSNHRSLIVAAVILVVGACGGDTTGPARGSGLYRLASVNGVPVPAYFPPSTGLDAVLSGDLYLRADGTFGLGLQCTPCGLLEGAWRLAGSTLHLTRHGGADIAAELEGDSVSLVFSESDRVYVFRRDRRARVNPASVAGTYVMTELMGRPDLTFEYTVGEEQYVFRILYDTLTVIDDVFFRRAREEITIRVATGDTVSSQSFASSGAFDVEGETLLLRHYFSDAAVAPPQDSLRILEDGLERRVAIRSPDWRETYTRLR
ncbi:MAG TPA: hypothetical protein VKZ85_11175 [Woeseiaceae bacterium]|nr:hypothetical protein [Woeseiaceae bacterium]